MGHTLWKIACGILIIIIAIIIIPLYDFFRTETAMHREITNLRNKNADIETELKEKKAEEVTTQDTVLPLITFTNEEYLAGDEKERIEKQLIGPYRMYYNEHIPQVISLSITVPKETGEPFKVVSVFKDGTTESFSYGMKNDVLEYWMPNCEGEPGCLFTELFRTTYPHIIENAEGP